MLLGACYRYVPTTGTDLVAGQVYRGHLSPNGTERVARLMGADVGRFDGRVVTATDTALLVAISSTVKRSDPRRMIWSGEQLAIPRDAIATYERRELDGRRTMGAALLGAAAILATGAIWLSIKGKAEGNPGPGPSPGPMAARVPCC
jgi:hypothetical protein